MTTKFRCAKIRNANKPEMHVEYKPLQQNIMEYIIVAEC